MFRTLSDIEIRTLCSELADDEENLFFVNELSDCLSRGGCSVLSNGLLHAVVFPAAAVLAAGKGWHGCKGDATFILSLELNVIAAPERVMREIPLRGYSKEKRSLMTITPPDFHCKVRDNRLRVLRTDDDFRSLFALYRRVPGMEDGFLESDEEDNLEDFPLREPPFSAIAMFLDGKAVSGAYIGNHRKKNALLCGVATDPGYRKRGYASAVISRILDISFTEKRMKRLSLWYTDENAGKLYRTLGFRDAGTWTCMRRIR